MVEPRSIDRSAMVREGLDRALERKPAYELADNR